MVDGGWVEWAAQGAVHDVVALGAVLAADVLDDADVAAVDDDVGCVVVAVEAGAEVRALHVCRQRVGAVGRAGEEDRRVFCTLWHEDHGVKLDAVAHRDHDLAPVVVEAAVCRHECRGRLARQGGRWLRRSLGGCDGEQAAEDGGGEQTSAEQKRAHMFPFHGEDRRETHCRSCWGVRVLTVIICGDWSKLLNVWLSWSLECISVPGDASISVLPPGVPPSPAQKVIRFSYLRQTIACKIFITRGLRLKYYF